MHSDEIFHLVATELSDTLSADDRRRLDEWVAASADNARLHARLVRIWDATPDARSLAAYDREAAYRLFLSRVAQAQAGPAPLQASPSHRPALRRIVMRVTGYAAMLAVVLGACSWLFFRLGQKELEASFAQIVVEAPEGATSKVTLPDGTAVWLNAGSRIAYSQGFGVKERQVSLTGEGYFEVRKNKDIPFNVSTGSISVRVLGTKFDFRDYPADPTAMVSLDEGSVALAVNAHREAGEYRLSPNQRAVLDKRGGSLTVEDCPAHDGRLWTDGTIMLNGRRLADIAADLGRTYAARIVIADSALRDVRFYGVFHRKDQSLQQILSTLAGTGRIRYEIHGNKVRIY